MAEKETLDVGGLSDELLLEDFIKIAQGLGFCRMWEEAGKVELPLVPEEERIPIYSEFTFYNMILKETSKAEKKIWPVFGEVKAEILRRMKGEKGEKQRDILPAEQDGSAGGSVYMCPGGIPL